MLDWNDLKLVLAIVETGTLSGATTRLDASQPTISRRLAKLEKDIGTALFERRRGGYRSTPTGERVYASALKMEREVAQMRRNILDDGSPEGHISLCASEDLAACCVVPLLSRFHRHYPNISLEIKNASAKIDEHLPIADILISMDARKNSLLTQHYVGRAHFEIYGSVSYFARHGEPTGLAELKNHHIISARADIGDLSFMKPLRDAAKSATAGFSSESYSNQLAAVQSGLGLAALPTYLTVNQPDIQATLTDKFCPDADVWLHVRKDVSRAHRIHLMVDFLSTSLRAQLTQFTPRAEI